ncbi:hypothetical protein [Chryseobacterium sp. ISL-6]|uniref:hypothetical protein n=1 Tax=Chryseobacterium sp. ISL-6 TaxID=2819143 RepID=UPI001BE54F43|nr:hypothetical protein [Chryseobacterium sp. ISL-6]MBT2622613.1 hypothetical protein [Chryseobacterium sp. ISL-6]
MRYIILILSVILFTSCKSLNNQKQEGYKIYKIENLHSYYIVYCEKDGEKYKIVSKEQNDKTINKYKKIKIGNSYNFALTLYHPNNKDNNPLTNTSTFLNVLHCYMFDGTKVCEEENGLYTTENLKGLYYIK